MKKRILTIALAFMFLFSQFSLLLSAKAKAETNEFSAEVVVLGPDKELKRATSSKVNAYEALEGTVGKENIVSFDSQYGKYVSEVYKVKAEGTKGWQYAVNRNGKYVELSTSIDGFSLENGDKLIFYYGDWNTTLLANRIELSTTSPNKDLTIYLNSNGFDSTTWEPMVKPIKNINVKIDGKEVNLNENMVFIKGGLPVGKHTIELSDFRTNGVPGVVADKIDFNIKRPNASVRVEGLNGTILEDSASGNNILEIVESVLNKNNIPYTIAKSSWGSSYIESINGLKEKSLKGYDGWLFYVKKPSMIISPNVGMDGYIPDDKDSIVVYYGDIITPYVNNIEFIPNSGAIVKENESFKIKFSYKSTNWIQNDKGEWIPVDSETLIKKAIVVIDSLNYITNDKGEINVCGLKKGEHTYKISGYNIDKLPTVVMDKGVFTIDNIHNPSMNYDDSKYDNLYDNDNSIIKKDIDKELSETLQYIKNNSKDPWAAISLNKYGIKASDDFIKSSAEDLRKYGIEDYLNTDIEKLILNLIANGYSPYNFEGYNLVSELFNRDVNDFLINDALFGLIVYKYGNITGSYKITEDKLVKCVLNKAITYKSGQNEIYGWALSGDRINPDITGGVINALSKYYDKSSEVKNAVDRAVKSLSVLENQSGYLADNYGVFSESLSFAILGLTSIGVNPEGIDFTKAKGDLVSGLLSFKGTNGQYKHSLDGGNNYIATEQALRALVALKEYKKTGKYDFFKSNIISKDLPVYEYTSQEKTSNNDNSSNTRGTSIKKTSTNEVAKDVQLDNNYEGNPVQNERNTIIKAINEAQDKEVIRVDARNNTRHYNTSIIIGGSMAVVGLALIIFLLRSKKEAVK